MQYYGFIVHS